MFGRLFMIGFDQSAWDDALADLLAEIKPGAVIFFNRNTKAGPAAFRELVARVRDALDGSVLLAADVEGGTVDRLRDLLAPLPAARVVADTQDDSRMTKFGALVGEAMRALGLNLNLAPVLDLASPIMGTRAASDRPAGVLRFARNFLAGLRSQNVIGCGKHFPGLGTGAVDTHSEMAVIDTPAAKLWEEDLLPFRALANDLPMIMMSHAHYSALETAPRPATLSPSIIGGLLRERIGFSGLVVSDDLEMGGVIGDRSIGEAAVAAVEAGCQILPICHLVERVRDAHAAVMKYADSNAEFAAQVTAASHAVEAFTNQHRPEPAGSADLDDLKRRIQDFAEECRCASRA